MKRNAYAPPNNYFKVHRPRRFRDCDSWAARPETESAFVVSSRIFPFNDATPVDAWRAAVNAAQGDAQAVVVWRRVSGRQAAGQWAGCAEIAP